MFRSAVFAGAFGLLIAVPSHAALLLQPNDRLALCGDGMTADLGYTVYLEDYLLACEQVPNLVTAEFGWSAQTPDGFLARLNTDLAPFKPTIATICYNFFGNPADANAINGRRKGETDLIEALKKMGVRTIVLGSPPYAGSDNLAPVVSLDQDVAAKEGIVYADVFGATEAATAKAHAKFGPTFVVDGDGTALTIAYAFLKAFGCEGDIGKITVDFTPDFHIGKAEGSPGHTVQSFDDQTLKAVSTRYAFFFPGYPNGKPLPEPFPSCVPFDAELNRFILVVKNLPSPAAKVYWNDKWHDYTAEELAKGVNLPEGIPAMFEKFQNIDGGIRDLMQSERIAGSARVQGKPDPKAEAAAKTALQIAKSRLVPDSYSIRIQPLAAPEKQPPGPVNIIFDTDMSGDIDDVVALVLINDFMNQGECNILACNVNMHDAAKSSGAVVQAINAYYGHPNIPIGACYDPKSGSCGSQYTAAIHKQFDPDFPNDDKLPNAVDVYRKALAAAPDHSVVICSVGWMENLTNLLKSGPDDASPLSGPDLVKLKVRKMVNMANTNPNDVWVDQNWPTPILWTTDIGNYIYPGKGLKLTPADNPARVIFDICHTENRQGWDPTAAWLAVRGPGDVYEVTAGGYWRVNVPPAGYGTWVNGPQTNQGMATVKMPSDQVLKLFDDELALSPKSAATH